MSWQEDLRRLDVELAGGKLSKLQYTARREELLAKASSEAEARPRARRPHPTKTPVKPSSTVSATALLTTDCPTSAPSPADERSTDSMAHPPVPPASPAPPRVPVTPPLVPPRAAAPLFEEAPAEPQAPVERRSPGKGRTWLLVAVSAVIAIGLIVGGLWWLNSDDDAGPAITAPPADSTTSTPQPPPVLFDRLPELPGVLHSVSGAVSVDEGVRRKFYAAREAAVLKKQGVREVTWKGSSRKSGDGQASYVILVAENGDAAGAKSTENALLKHAAGSAKPIDPLENVPAFKLPVDKSTIYFVIYPSEQYTVIVSAVQTDSGGDAELKAQLAEVVAEVVEVLPPGQ